MEEVSNIATSSLLVAYTAGGLEKGFVRKVAQEGNRVKQVRFSHAIWPGDAGEWSEVNVNIHQVLEAIHDKACEHSFSIAVYYLVFRFGDPVRKKCGIGD